MSSKDSCAVSDQLISQELVDLRFGHPGSIVTIQRCNWYVQDRLAWTDPANSEGEHWWTALVDFLCTVLVDSTGGQHLQTTLVDGIGGHQRWTSLFNNSGGQHW